MLSQHRCQIQDVHFLQDKHPSSCKPFNLNMYYISNR